MRALCEALGEPQSRFASLHVVGTNGKSSVTVMAAALLEASGMRSGTSTSPHVWRWSERIRIGGVELEPAAFAAAVERVAEAVPAVEGELGGGERITQFEAATASSFVALADAGVDAAVIEAGLGGRLDATNVIPSTATALTSVGLDHTEWLGETELEIAAEKLAVLRDGSALITGDLSPAVAELAGRTAAERAAALLEPRPLDPKLLPGGFAPYLARNAAVATALAETIAGPLPPDLVRRALAEVALPGRLEALAGDPPLLVDAAHNEQGARALAEALAARGGGGPLIGCLSVLADKDAGAIVAALAPHLSHCICTAADPGAAMGRPGARAAEPDELVGLLAAAGVEAEAVADPGAAIERALELARRRQGVALCAGSHYLLRYAWTARRAQNSSR
jgi:dihydrofolate synthase/folylpolyglutamate synthase